MCGRFVQKSKKAELVAKFGCGAQAAAQVPANYNLSPTQDAAVVRFNPADGKRHLNLLRWGLIPGDLFPKFLPVGSRFLVVMNAS